MVRRPSSRSVAGSGGLTSGSSGRSRKHGRSATSNSTRSAKKYSYGVRTTDGWIVPPSGLTSALSMGFPGVVSWIAWLQASRVSPSPQPGSDVDILVEMPAKSSLFDFLELQSDLEERLSRSVDLVEYSAVKERLKPYILGDQTPLYTT